MEQKNWKKGNNVCCTSSAEGNKDSGWHGLGFIKEEKQMQEMKKKEQKKVPTT